MPFAVVGLVGYLLRGFYLIFAFASASTLLASFVLNRYFGADPEI